MENRIRVAALIFKGDKILLVKHVHPKTGFAWWVPPGGGLQNRETLFECGQREVMEDTGLSVTFDKIVYLRQFISSEFGKNNIEVFLSTSAFTGKETIKNIHGNWEDEHFIKGLRYFT